MIKFQSFESIARLNRPVVVTEKIDGTNAQIVVLSEFEAEGHVGDPFLRTVTIGGEHKYIAAGSRTRWIRPGDDNSAFARWVWDNAEELVTGLGEGRHSGEWWGMGIARGYGLKEKRFSLFNTHLWTAETTPKCCHVVPILLTSPVFNTAEILQAMADLAQTGSIAAPGFMSPEGVVAFHTASSTYFKATFEFDATGKTAGGATP